MTRSHVVRGFILFHLAFFLGGMVVFGGIFLLVGFIDDFADKRGWSESRVFRTLQSLLIFVLFAGFALGVVCLYAYLVSLFLPELAEFFSGHLRFWMSLLGLD